MSDEARALDHVETDEEGAEDGSMGWEMEFANGRSIRVGAFPVADDDEDADPSDLIQIEALDSPDDPEPWTLLLNANEAATLAGYLSLAVQKMIEWGCPMAPSRDEEPDDPDIQGA